MSYPASGLPEATFLRAFLGAAAVSTVLSVATARLADRRFDLGRLDREIRRLDTEGEP